MRVVILSETYAANMGYLENCLPRFLARLGVDVHLVTCGLPPYYQRSDTQGMFDGLARRAGADGNGDDGVTVHLLKPERRLGYVRMAGLAGKLGAIRPDIVQTTAAIGWIPLDCALARPRYGFRLFTGNHNAASTFPLARRKTGWGDPEYVRCIATRFLPGRLVSLVTEKCYAVTVDCADIAVRFFGVQQPKVEVMHLGVDTGIFYPATPDDRRERDDIRERLGIGADEVVCVYTGKLSEEKNAVILAQAIGRLREEGERFHGLFIGAGAQEEAIRASPGCTLLEFMPHADLGAYYRAADVGVWPTNESTSMLDAAACGLPLVVSDGIVYRDHVEGNGVVVRMNDLEDLLSHLRRLGDPGERGRLGSAGARKMAEKFSWDRVARLRLKDYETALARRGGIA